MNRWEKLKYRPKFRSSYLRVRRPRRGPDVAAGIFEPDNVEMTVAPGDLEKGVRAYWDAINRRPVEVQTLEREFPKLTGKFLGRTPPHFVREDLELIVRWKYAFDCRICDRALAGLQSVSDARIRSLTRHIGVDRLAYLLPWFRGVIPGVGIAGLSSILAAARPDLYPVMDDFSLRAVYVYYDLPWMTTVKRDTHGRFLAEEQHYVPYTAFCQACARWATAQAGRRWTPRDVEMALWGIGKELDVPLE